jgi:hypothetical protein
MDRVTPQTLTEMLKCNAAAVTRSFGDCTMRLASDQTLNEQAAALHSSSVSAIVASPLIALRNPSPVHCEDALEEVIEAQG